MKEILIGIMGLVFGGRSDDWTPTKEDYYVFFSMILIVALTVGFLSV